MKKKNSNEEDKKRSALPYLSLRSTCFPQQLTRKNRKSAAHDGVHRLLLVERHQTWCSVLVDDSTTRYCPRFLCFVQFFLLGLLLETGKPDGNGNLHMCFSSSGLQQQDEGKSRSFAMHPSSPSGSSLSGDNQEASCLDALPHQQSLLFSDGLEVLVRIPSASHPHCVVAYPFYFFYAPKGWAA